MNLMDQCWNNVSYQSWNNTQWSGNCTGNQYCTNNSWGGCEPRCQTRVNSTDCVGGVLNSSCKWVTGWCNAATTNQMFTGMEAGAPVPLGADSCPETGMQASVDLCGFGMKDMKDSFGFGGGAIGGGVATTFGTERTGSGNDTVIYFVYLDSDGTTSGGCDLDYNSSAVGYEFRFKYSSIWNISLAKAVETFNAYKCEDSSWKATDIKLSAWKKIMCSEIGGIMLAVTKADLVKFPTLYDSTKDMRVAVAIIGNTGNITSPTDTAGPAWTTPGSIDFDIKNAFAYGADTAKFEDILKKGFVQYEDCYNGNDDDGDGNIDCNDWNCQYSSKCNSTGVNAAGYNDTKAPQVIGVKIEEYNDAALIMYDTNKPTNGSLELFGHGDTTCTNRTDIVYDVGSLKNNTVRQYKLWHSTLIYNDNSTA
ncbi:hypothetical protein HZB88_02080, partial [archaeon]|nr:hypothetical protein [archaeon]